MARQPSVFLVAGLGALLAQDEAESRRMREKVEEVKQKGYWERYFTMRREVGRIDIVSHWRMRPGARRSVWIGLALMVVVIAGLLL